MTSVDSRPNVPLLVGGGVVGATGLTLGTVGLTYQLRVGHNERKVETRQGELADARRGQQAAEGALAADRVHPPAGTSSTEAKRWLTERFSPIDDARVLTREGSTKLIDITRFGAMTRSESDAAAAASELGEGRAAGVVRAGEWYAPVKFDDSLLPLEKTRTVSYKETVWEYHYGPNPANGG
ncbi:MAG: hypothetical protein JWO69_1511, partial [Thermoleophilia bacterium]|nr:hypothetical protein [Thermoleophilia bacterium]